MKGGNDIHSMNGLALFSDLNLLFRGKVLKMRQASINKTLICGLLGLGIMFGLSGCKDTERDRILMYKKGTYLGQADQSLGADAVNKLQSRTRYQFASGN